ncbi:MAG: hypothetical protein GY841_13115 [FCB group bacterium]|nr:hypothetical protein [FCB group bacterium]
MAARRRHKMYTYTVQNMANMALAYKDPDAWFQADEIFVPQMVNTIKGSYDVDDALAWFQNVDMHVGPDGYPTSMDIGNSTVEWSTEPRGKNISINIADLKDYGSRNYTSAEQMKQVKWELLIRTARINKEIAAVAQITTDGNYDAANRHVIGAGDFAASLAWSNANSRPINDVDFLVRENSRANTIAMSWTTFRDLMINPQILDYGSITAESRDNMTPKVSIRYLESCFNLRVVIFKSEAVTAATADLPIASQVKGEIWGDYIWTGVVNKASQGARMELPTWGHQYIYSPVTDNRGWIMTETIDQRAGAGVGELKLDLGYYNQYKTYATSYGQRLNGVN